MLDILEYRVGFEEATIYREVLMTVICVTFLGSSLL